MAADDVVRTLDKAVAAAALLAVGVDGWMLQRDADGFAAWLYVEEQDDDSDVITQTSLFVAAEVHATAEDAAAWVLREATRLRDPEPDLEVS